MGLGILGLVLILHSTEKDKFSGLIRSNDDLGNETYRQLYASAFEEDIRKMRHRFSIAADGINELFLDCNSCLQFRSASTPK